MKSIALFLIIIVICGCAARTPAIQVNTPFTEDDYINYAKDGTGSIKGQAFLKTRAGDVKYGAGTTVYLIPITSYTKDLMNKAIEKGGGFTTNMDYRLNKYIKTTTADGEGRFEFKKLPPGDYYVGCQIAWKYATQYGLMPTGGNIVNQANVKEGEAVKVILTR
jgi:hypothetical protein